VSATPGGDGPIIAVRGLTKRFGDFTAVDDLTIEVPPGSIFAFLGANGSGKSTTIRMLIGLLTPTHGTVRVDGIDVIATPRRVRDHIGYMGQKVSLYQGLSVRENVEFYAGLHGIAGRDLDERWDALRERFALASAEGERPENLPAGIRQRAGLALAMLHRPRVLFLDEPTAGVDVESRGLFWDAIQDEAHAGTTVFVTTHFLEEVDYCDWVSFIDRGRLIANDTPESLRLRYGGGYRVRVRAGEGPYARGAAALDRIASALGATGVTVTPEGDALDVRADGSIDALRRRIAGALAGPEAAGARVEIEMPHMTDVFREVIRRAEAEAGAARDAA
jgi:ABC-2 type transport system ATP-binding protein